LLRSGNTYYVVSGALSSLVFAIPMVISIVLYIRNRGFLPDGDLSNATMPVKPAPERVAREEAPVALPPRVAFSSNKVLLCIVLVGAAAGITAMRIPSIDDAVDYRTTRAEAKRIAAPALPAPRQRVIATPVEGFRNWERDSGREDGGSPGGFDSIAANYMLRNGLSMRALLDVMRTKIEAATWMVRAFTPMQKEEYFVEIDPRDARVVGYHKYQDEKRPGARLDQAPAQAIAQNAFAK